MVDEGILMVDEGKGEDSISGDGCYAEVLGNLQQIVVLLLCLIKYRSR